MAWAPLSLPGIFPRVCGEKVKSAQAGKQYVGSPPRVRGKASMWGDAETTDRITPTCAGKSSTASNRHSPCWDHPRVCGEKEEGQRDPEWRKGLPPRVRGKVDQPHNILVQGGITPACAGKSAERHLVAIACQDHPRVCGEKLSPVFADLQYGGSPPRVRGKVQPYTQLYMCNRITPACAGKRLSSIILIGQNQDHPRVCGEKSLLLQIGVVLPGSPPRVRGKVSSFSSVPATGGITPACAGKSVTSRK